MHGAAIIALRIKPHSGCSALVGTKLEAALTATVEQWSFTRKNAGHVLHQMVPVVPTTQPLPILGVKTIASHKAAPRKLLLIRRPVARTRKVDPTATASVAGTVIGEHSTPIPWLDLNSLTCHVNG